MGNEPNLPIRRSRVAIIGRPNVGKSTLFNRLVGKRLALTDDTPGVTRDRREGEARIGHLTFLIIDTAGMEDAAADSLAGRMRAQTDMAIAGADVTLFMVDARAGVTPLDKYFAETIRRTGMPVILVANKAEGRGGTTGFYEAFDLGFGEPIPISAEHGEGLNDLAEALVPYVEKAGDAADVAEAVQATEDTSAPLRPMQVAVVGRPNAGKSTLINTIIGEERLLTSPVAGTTRDSISVEWEWRGRSFRVFDTAGLRRKARIEEKLEKLSVADALRAIRFAEVVVLVIDATMPFEKQDLQIADLIEREGRAVVIALNKWDMIEDRTRKLPELRLAAEKLLPQIRGAPVVPVSGLTGEGIERLLQAVIAAHKVWNKRISTGALNRWLGAAIEAHPPPAEGGRSIKLRYMTQAKSRPPTFIAFCSRPDALPEAYKRYLVNGLREAFALAGTPIRLMLRKGENPYADKG